jgi:hypothetical protein
VSHPPKKLLDQVRDAIRLKHYSIHTEETYSIGSNVSFSPTTSVIRANWARRKSKPFSPSWRDPAHPTAHARFRHIFRDHWDSWCYLRLDAEVPLDQQAYVHV